eukprot:m.331990 g.331990  ORF g.331990 m.331990 type:complete len:358 (+) comp16841_c0_seq1:1055-2128(+)
MASVCGIFPYKSRCEYSILTFIMADMHPGILAAVLAAIVSLVSAEVPIIGWTNSEGVFSNVEDLRAGHAISLPEVLSSHLEQTARKGLVVMFTQDVLHVADFAKHGPTTFQFVQNSLKQSKDSIVISEVVQEEDGVAASLSDYMTYVHLKSEENFIIMNTDEIDTKLDDVKRVLAKNDGGVIVLVPLKNVAGIEDKAALLKENDNSMKEAMSKLSPLDSSVTVLYTAQSSHTNRDRRAMLMDYGQLGNGTNTTSMTGCSRWPESIAFPQGRGTRTCRPKKAYLLNRGPLSGGSVRQDVVAVPQPTLFFSVPILMGITVAAIIIPCFLGGTYGLMIMQTNSRYPNVDDVPLIISTANE